MIQKFSRSRWPKRILFVSCCLLAALIFIGAIAPEPRLRPREANATNLWTKDLRQVAGLVDEQIESKIGTDGLEQAPLANWQAICRRLSLALVGNTPSLEELRAIEQIGEEERIEWWTDYLLTDSRWSHHFSERFSRAYVGTNEGPFLLFRRRKFQLWLAEEFIKGRPYNQIVRKIISAQGLWTDNPEVNFLTSTISEDSKGRVDPILLAGRASRAFLGMRIDCLQCHDDLLGNVGFGDEGLPRPGTQLDFQSLAAYFSGARVSGKNALAGLQDDHLPYRVQLLGDSKESVVKPNVPFLNSLELPSDSPRKQLAVWITDSKNKAFARATVNRIWAILFGLPLVNPVDNIPMNGPFPAGLELLADTFVEHDYDIRALIRIIVATKVFQRASRFEDRLVTAEHEATWAVFPLSQLRPEQVAASMLQACRLQMIDNDSSILSQLERYGTLNDFTKEYGDRGEDEFIAQHVTLPQRLLMMNGKFIRERIDENPVMNANSQIALLSATNSQTVEAAYLSVLSRRPTEAERAAFVEKLAGKKGKGRSQAISDLFWILLNSTEFLWNH